MSNPSTTPKMEDIISLCKRRGFIYQGSEVYGGLAGTWDYGPLGVTLKRNIMQLWWKMFVLDRDDMYGIDAAILMNQKVWQASGHADTFTDPVVVCMNCNSRLRVDKVIDTKSYKNFLDKVLPHLLDVIYEQFEKDSAIAKNKDKKLKVKDLDAEFNKFQELRNRYYHASDPITKDNDAQQIIKFGEYLKSESKKVISATEDVSLAYGQANIFGELVKMISIKIDEANNYLGDFAKIYLDTHVKCPVCGVKKWGTPRTFNMMFKTHIGPLEDSSSVSYLRPETAQGIFTNYKNVIDSFYPELPFGLAQQGKAFRNEISPRDFVFRSREFEQMEIEYFVSPTNWEDEFEKWRNLIWEWTKELGLTQESVHELEVPADDRAHYSKRTIDFEFDYPIGREEMLGLAYRTDFDLMNIQNNSGRKMDYRPKDGSTPFVPHVIEPSFGLERALMAVLTAAYNEDEQGGEKRVYLKLPVSLAPVRVAVSPLLKNKPELVAKAREVYASLKKEFGNVMWDDNGNIGKRYRRQDEIGTPYCVTIDFDTLEDDTVTVRERDSTEQKRIAIKDLIDSVK